MPRGCWEAAIAAGLLIALAQPARADDALDGARGDIDASDYLGARTALDRALAKGDATPADLAEIYKLSGIVEAALGNTAPATAAFAKWLSLDPKGSLPPGTSPKIMRPWKAASDKARALEVKAETSADPPTVTLVVVADPQQLIAKARVLVVVDGKPVETRDGAAGAAIALPNGRRLDLRVQGLDDHGNRVVELGTASVPIVITGAGKVEPQKKPNQVAQIPRGPDHPRKWYGQWWVWGAATGAATLTAAYFGYALHGELGQLDHLNATSLDHPFSDAQAVEARAHRDVMFADVALGLAGVLAIGTGILYVTRPHLEVAPVPMPGGGAVVLGGQF